MLAVIISSWWVYKKAISFPDTFLQNLQNDYTLFL